MSEKSTYLDTSAYLEDLFYQTRAASVRSALSGHNVFSSVLLILEAERNIIRMSRIGLLSEENSAIAMDRLLADRDHFTLRPLTHDLCLTWTFPPVRTPRSNDLVHLRTALWFYRRHEIGSFLTLDESQKAAAKELGLPVVEIS